MNRIDNNQPVRTHVEEIQVVGDMLGDEQLRLVAGGRSRLTLRVSNQGPTCPDVELDPQI